MSWRARACLTYLVKEPFYFMGCISHEIKGLPTITILPAWLFSHHELVHVAMKKNVRSPHGWYYTDIHCDDSFCYSITLWNWTTLAEEHIVSYRRSYSGLYGPPRGCVPSEKTISALYEQVSNDHAHPDLSLSGTRSPFRHSYRETIIIQCSRYNCSTTISRSIGNTKTSD